MNAEPLSYCARLKQRADLSAVIRLADSFLDLWAEDAAEGSDEERAELAKARAEFTAVRPLVEAAPQLCDTLMLIAENAPAEDPGEGDWGKGLDSAFSAGIEAGRFEAAKLARDALSGVAGERWTVLLRRVYSDDPGSTYLAHVVADDEEWARVQAMVEAIRADGGENDAGHYETLLVIRGHHLDASS